MHEDGTVQDPQLRHGADLDEWQNAKHQGVVPFWALRHITYACLLENAGSAW